MHAPYGPNDIRRRSLRGLTIVAAIALTGCAAAGTRVTANLNHSYQPGTLGLVATGDHQIKVDIRQKPYTVPDAVFTDTVVGAMQGRTQGRVINFSVDPVNPYPGSNYRTVLLFGPPANSHPRQLCKQDFLDQAAPQGSLQLAAGAPGVVQVDGALCNDNLAVSWASGQSTQAPSVDSRGFDQLIAQMTLALFPAQNRNLDDDECFRIPNLC